MLLVFWVCFYGLRPSWAVGILPAGVKTGMEHGAAERKGSQWPWVLSYIERLGRMNLDKKREQIGKS